MRSILKPGWMIVFVVAFQARSGWCASPADGVRAKWDEAAVQAKKSFTPENNAAVVKIMEEAAGMARRSGDDRLLADALEKLGTEYSNKLTQPAKGVAAQEESLSLYRKLKDDDAKFRLLRVLASAYSRMEKWDKVISYNEEAFTLNVPALTLEERDDIHSQVGNAYSKKGDSQGPSRPTRAVSRSRSRPARPRRPADPRVHRPELVCSAITAPPSPL